MEIEVVIKLMCPSADQVDVSKYSQDLLQGIGGPITRDRFGRSSWVHGLFLENNFCFN